MQPKLIKTQHAEYVKAEYSGTNESGVRPIGDRVLILPDEAAEKTTGNVMLPQATVERGSMAAETGVLVELGDGAFVWNSDRSRPFAGTKPKVGERIIFEKYAGQLMIGKDGRFYRLADDKTIGAVDDFPNL